MIKDWEKFNESTKNSGIEILSIRRSDGVVFIIGDKYLDGNNSEYTIDEIFTDGDNIYFHGKGGGEIQAKYARSVKKGPSFEDEGPGGSLKVDYR